MADQMNIHRAVTEMVRDQGTRQSNAVSELNNTTFTQAAGDIASDMGGTQR